MPLSMPTSVIAAFTLGVLVDDTVHFLIHYREALGRGLDPEAAIEDVFGVVGRAILLNAAALSVAFLVLTGSSFRPIAQSGWLTAGTLFAGLASELLLLPLLLRWCVRKPTKEVARFYEEKRMTHQEVSL